MPSVPQIFDRYLGLGPAPAGQGTTWKWSIEPPVALDSAGPFLLLIAVVVLVLVFGRCDFHRVSRRVRYGVLALRLVSLGVLTLMICRLSLHVLRTGHPAVAVLVDTSPSMTVSDEYDPAVRARLPEQVGQGRGTRRIDLVQRLLTADKQQWLESLEEHYRVEIFTFSEDVGEEDLMARRGTKGGAAGVGQLALSPAGRRTNLRLSLANLLDRYRGAPPAAVVVLSDGVSTTGEANTLSEGANAARRMRVPLFIVGVGSSRAVKDLSIAEVHTDAVAFVGDSHAFQVKLNASRVPKGKVKVVLSQSGQPDALDSAEATFREGETSYTVELSHVPNAPGPIDYEIAVQPIAGESNLQNNRAQARVWVRQERLRVLLVERLPRWEFRHLKAVLERDRTVELKTWLQDADADFIREDRTALSRLPLSLEELANYDAVVLGDVDPDALPPGFPVALQEFVGSLGGGLFLLVGPKHLPGDYFGEDWNKLVPVSTGRTEADSVNFAPLQGRGLKLQPTIEGRAHPILKLGQAGRARSWDTFPPVYGVAENVSVKESAQVLLKGDLSDGGGTRPLLVTQRFGAGVVLLQLFDESWRWRSIDDGAPFRRYWSQVVRFLSKRKAIEDHSSATLRTDRTEYVVGEPVELSLVGATAEAASEAVRVVVVGPGGQTRDVTLEPAAGHLPEVSARIEGLAQGAYSARPMTDLPNSGPLITTWKVLSVDPERIFQPMNETDLQRAAEISGGRFYNLWEARRLPDDLPRGRSRQLEQRSIVPLWDRWEMLFMLAAALVGEWALRKRCRLL